jgi:hypothetical protein
MFRRRRLSQLEQDVVTILNWIQRLDAKLERVLRAMGVGDGEEEWPDA